MIFIHPSHKTFIEIQKWNFAKALNRDQERVIKTFAKFTLLTKEQVEADRCKVIDYLI